VRIRKTDQSDSARLIVITDVSVDVFPNMVVDFAIDNHGDVIVGVSAVPTDLPYESVCRVYVNEV
jgi:hypothetical protein